MRGHRGERCGHNPLAYDTSWSDGNSELLAHSGSRDQSSRFAGDIARSIGDSSYYGYTGTNTRACFPNSRQCDGQTGKHPGRERAGSLFYSSPSGDGQCRPGKPPRGRKPSTGPRYHRRGRLDGWAWPQIPLDSSPVNSCIAVVHGNQARPPLTGGVTSNQRVMTHAAVSVAELLLFTGRPAGATWAPGRSLWRMGCTPAGSMSQYQRHARTFRRKPRTRSWPQCKLPHHSTAPSAGASLSLNATSTEPTAAA